MSPRRQAAVIAGAAAAILAVSFSGTAQAQNGQERSLCYALTVLPPPDSGHPIGFSTGVNNRGEVIGYGYQYPMNPTAYFWSAKTGLLDLGVLPGEGPSSSAQGINNRGEVTGWSGDTSSNFAAFTWSANTSMEPLTNPPPYPRVVAFAINEPGQVAGYFSSGNALPQHAFIWSQQTGTQELGFLPGGGFSVAFGMNNTGQAVGTAGVPGGEHAFFWSYGTGMQDLGTLPGGTISFATGINDAAEVVGWSASTTGSSAFLWTAQTQMKDLGSLLGPGGSSSAAAINAEGDVVGKSQSLGGQHAFLWTPSGGMTDLNTVTDKTTPTFVLEEANGISDNGHIVGDGFDTAEGTRRAFLLTPGRGCQPQGQ